MGQFKIIVHWLNYNNQNKNARFWVAASIPNFSNIVKKGGILTDMVLLVFEVLCQQAHQITKEVPPIKG